MSLIKMPPQIGERIKAKRLKRGMTLANVAHMAGVQKSTIHYVESGRDVQVTTLLSICCAIGIKPAALFKS